MCPKDSILPILIPRSFLPPGVKRVVVEEKGVYAVLFLPKDIPEGSKVPLINVINGGIQKKGHLKEDKAAMYAAHGFAGAVLGFFGVGDLPDRYKDVSIEHFDRTIDALLGSEHGQLLDESRYVPTLTLGSRIGTPSTYSCQQSGSSRHL